MAVSDTVLFISGLNDSNLATVHLNDKGNPIASADGSANIFPYVQLGGFKSHRLIVAVQPKLSLDIPRPGLIFNELSNPDTHKKVLFIAGKIIKECGNVRVLNPVNRVEHTHRDLVYENIKSISGINFSKTIRFAPVDRDDLIRKIEQEFSLSPVLIRETGTHGGKTVILWDIEKSPALLDRYAIDGREFYVARWVDFHSGDGFFRKYRIAVVGGEPYLRHVLADRTWNIHANSRRRMISEFPQLMEEEQAHFNSFDSELKPEIKHRIAQIHKAIGLDYFGIDCAISDDGDLIIFEANAAMNILNLSTPSPDYLEKPVNKIRKAIHKLILQNLTARTRN